MGNLRCAVPSDGPSRRVSVGHGLPGAGSRQTRWCSASPAGLAARLIYRWPSGGSSRLPPLALTGGAGRALHTWSMSSGRTAENRQPSGRGSPGSVGSTQTVPTCAMPSERSLSGSLAKTSTSKPSGTVGSGRPAPAVGRGGVVRGRVSARTRSPGRYGSGALVRFLSGGCLRSGRERSGHGRCDAGPGLVDNPPDLGPGRFGSGSRESFHVVAGCRRLRRTSPPQNKEPPTGPSGHPCGGVAQDTALASALRTIVHCDLVSRTEGKPPPLRGIGARAAFDRAPGRLFRSQATGSA